MHDSIFSATLKWIFPAASVVTTPAWQDRIPALGGLPVDIATGGDHLEHGPDGWPRRRRSDRVGERGRLRRRSSTAGSVTVEDVVVPAESSSTRSLPHAATSPSEHDQGSA